MEDIIKKAIEGGYKHPQCYQFSFNEANRGTDWKWSGEKSIRTVFEMFCIDPLFWKTLGNACGWGGSFIFCEKCKMDSVREYECHHKRIDYTKHALRFHEINLTESWEKAVEYLTEVTK